MAKTKMVVSECIELNCGQRGNKRGYCPKHYMKARRNGLLPPPEAYPVCSWQGCTVRPKNGPVCYRHGGDGRKKQIPNPPCTFKGCQNRGYKSDDLCYWHVKQRDSGRALEPVQPHGGKVSLNGTPKCYREGCQGLPLVDGLCRNHYHQSLDSRWDGETSGMNTCPIKGCATLKRAAKILCTNHNSYARKYTLAPHLYRDMINAGCMICGEYSRMCIDHDHGCCDRSGRSCGKCVRGALCGNCNNMLGHGRTPEILRAGAEYLDGFTRP